MSIPIPWETNPKTRLPQKAARISGGIFRIRESAEGILCSIGHPSFHIKASACSGKTNVRGAESPDRMSRLLRQSSRSAVLVTFFLTHIYYKNFL